MCAAREVTPARAAKLLGINLETVYRWCHATIDGDGTTRFTRVRRSVTGRFFIDRDDIDEILAATKGLEYPDK